MKPRRSSIGFHGGQVLSLRLDQAVLDGVRDALKGGASERWLEVDAADGAVLIDLSQVNYLRTESDDQRVGF